jgi:hypothetical protein
MMEGKDWNLQHLPPHSLMASLLAQVRDLCNDQGVHEPDSAGCTFPDAFGVAGVSVGTKWRIDHELKVVTNNEHIVLPQTKMHMPDSPSASPSSMFKIWGPFSSAYSTSFSTLFCR